MPPPPPPTEERKPADGRVEDPLPSEPGEAIAMTPPTPPLKPSAENPSQSDVPPKAKQPKVEDNIARVPAEDLPSHHAEQRWNFEKRISEFMDELLPRLAVVTQKVNTYTGTDYSSIAALKREIKDQENLVKARRQAIEEAKQALDAAHAQQAASQKEVVALLERKHSWSATDLERYMALIRSEHVNDQAIREAKEAVASAENALEEARSQLEKRERAQYHEEQIWSDTIRRNSTWVTFGLMGLNIVLLLASLIVIEPWRRRRMVREIKAALEEAQKPVITAAPAVLPTTAAIEADIDKAVEPVGPLAEEGEAQPTPPGSVVTNEVLPSAVEISETTPNEAEAFLAPNPVIEPPTPPAVDIVEEAVSSDVPAETAQSKPNLQKITARLEALVSEEPISVRKKDLTAAICVSAAAGYVCAMVVFWFSSR
ncbi:uncharacterized protein EI97DRAFT_456432 [Westerdykella ornata]|uniref:Sensitive to high expression protein 9, mitochondrial n=1 Tax=Westerdykella ornata TaxID=318751 RepID=A0A6A6JRY9_WESOR|nr:uncharacterized protein EI97DRAFT_456432 [Westerdykella ornata]KAF2279025.1 hypothetical protein EI97DRAFT_456432 [Westerdykella ornata]